jgi:hypothetical protein
MYKYSKYIMYQAGELLIITILNSFKYCPVIFTSLLVFCLAETLNSYFCSPHHKGMSF